MDYIQGVRCNLEKELRHMADPQKDSGLYVIWMMLSMSARLQIGALGELDFTPGTYAYVGTAQRGRSARIRRHLAVDKPRRWHMDYLRPYVTVEGITLYDGHREDECRLVKQIMAATGAKRDHPGFGASDCRCGGHLLFLPRTLHEPENLEL
jgi:Uri superfamily endonuclease